MSRRTGRQASRSIPAGFPVALGRSRSGGYPAAAMPPRPTLVADRRAQPDVPTVGSVAPNASPRPVRSTGKSSPVHGRSGRPRGPGACSAGSRPAQTRLRPPWRRPSPPAACQGRPGRERVRRDRDTPERPGRDWSAARRDRAAPHPWRCGECRNARRSERPESPCPRPGARSSVPALLVSSPHYPARRPRPVAQPTRSAPAPNAAEPSGQAAPGSPRLAARKRIRRTPSYERQKPRTLMFMPHAISADIAPYPSHTPPADLRTKLAQLGCAHPPVRAVRLSRDRPHRQPAPAGRRPGRPGQGQHQAGRGEDQGCLRALTAQGRR